MTSPDEPDDIDGIDDTDGIDDIEVMLLALGDSLDIPAPPPAETARAVRARLEALPEDAPAPSAPEPSPADRSLPAPSAPEPSPPADPSRPAPRPRRGWRLLPAPVRRAERTAGPGARVRLRRVVISVVAVLVALFFGATPVGRAAVVEILRFAGIELRTGDPGPLPSGSPSPLPREGVTTLEEARRQVVFPIVVPAELGEPDEVRISDRGRVVSMVWPGVRLDQFDGMLEVVFRKELGPPWPEETTVDGSRASWIPAKHGLSYLPRGGGPPVATRLSGPTLIWQRGGVGLRLEGVPDRERAREIAQSVQ
ncbi:hypothetical protein GCM10010156_71180 [Planobispora rosea]|uniref:DUF4367 domain-containing protein n=1 Tax=Planobispora rosea TaxID=35762 RepID=A0A8J3S6G0_PLARO|nr:hypothetical protein [Planobispora rosea]GGT02997.1 hypothetical protein GCM10010156_71180 [Planobispora rosea]GIH86856.1 hypothetical protein Pro02_52640 [Planobispora rosea]